MTTYRAWNGSSWDTMSWCTDPGTYFVAPKFKTYTPPVAATSRTVASWSFNDGTAQGFKYYDGAGYNLTPGVSGGEMMLGKTGTNETPWTVSPSLSNADMDALRGKNLVAQCSIRVDHISGNIGSYGIDVSMKADFGGPLQEDSVFWEVWGDHGNVVLTGDYPLNVWQWDSPRIYFHSYCSDASANWMLYIDWVQFIDTATNQPVTDTTPYVPGFVPNAWNGSAWVPQTAP